jgi:hypothetical protein
MLRERVIEELKRSGHDADGLLALVDAHIVP